MNANYPAKTYLLGLIVTLFTTSLTYAQVGINTTTPADGSMLDVTSTEKGMLVPRVDIDNLNTIAPVTGGSTESLLVYNTNTTTGKGFYYWNGTLWIGMDGENDWKLDGNSGTNQSTNFVGTTDAQGLTFRTNDTERFRVANGDQVQAMGDGSIVAPFYSWNSDPTMGFYKSGVRQMSMSINGDQFFNANSNEPTVEWTFNPGGDDINLRVETDGDANTLFVDGLNDNVGMGTNTPTADVKLEVNGGVNNAIFGYSDNVGGYLGRESDITIGIAPNTQSILGAGVYANNPYAGYTSIFSQSTDAATVAANVNYSDVWIANYNYVDNDRSTYNPSGVYSQLNNTAGVVAYRSAIFGYSNSGTTSSSGGIDVGVRAQSVAQNDNVLGVYATCFSNGSDVSGGYFLSATYGGTVTSRTWVANYYAGTDYKVFGSGTVSTIVEGESNNHIMYAPEAPEVLFQDFGVGKLVNGATTIVIDPILAKNIVVDTNHPLKVYVTLEGECNGIYVTNKSKNGFTVRELQNGNSNVSFSWQIVANRKDRKGNSEFGESKFQDLRFPIFNKDHMPEIKKEKQVLANNKK